MANEFKNDFIARVRSDWSKVQVNNLDKYRFWQGRSLLRRIALKCGAERVRSVFRVIRTIHHSADIQWSWDALKDVQSKQLLIAVMAYRALGGNRVRLPLNSPGYWQSIEMIEHDLLRRSHVQTLRDGSCLDDYDLAPLDNPFHFRGRLGNVLNTFILQQYRLDRREHIIEAEQNDFVIDAGGCWGDTPLYFANLVGDKGRVYCYEFDPDNLSVFRHNMEINAGISGRIHLVEKALWSEPNQTLHFMPNGPSTRIVQDSSGATTVTTDTIDELVRREGLAKIDFIKMDIEGAELNALKGAEKTICVHRPKLAISIYHQLEHYWKIPKFIYNLDLGYEFFIEHFTIHAEETMLFAVVRR